MRWLLLATLLLFACLPEVMAAQKVGVPIEDVKWSVEYQTMGGPAAHHYDLVCQKPGVATPLRKKMAGPEVSFASLFSATELGTFVCHAEALTQQNALLAKSDGTVTFQLVAMPNGKVGLRIRIR